MKGFYSEMIQEINEMIKKGEEASALNKIEEELSMPYIPLDFQQAILALKQKLRPKMKTLKQIDDEMLLELLFGDEQKQLLAIHYLQELNLRHYMNEVKQVLAQPNHPFVRALLIDLMIEQQICEDIEIDVDGLQVLSNPSFIEPPLEADGAVAAMNLIVNWLENDNPSMCRLCLDDLSKEAFLHLPFNIEEDESDALALAIVRRVAGLMGDLKPFHCLIQEKSLAEIGDYELLLNKYDI